MLLARTEHEGAVFREVDARRERDVEERWHAQGNRGKPPPPLMQVEELPDCYQTDEPFAAKEEEDLLEGRGQRRRAVVNYTDNLDDDTWAKVIHLPFVFYNRLNKIVRLWKMAMTWTR